jgi:hypothetical protein
MPIGWHSGLFLTKTHSGNKTFFTALGFVVVLRFCVVLGWFTKPNNRAFLVLVRFGAARDAVLPAAFFWVLDETADGAALAVCGREMCGRGRIPTGTCSLWEGNVREGPNTNRDLFLTYFEPTFYIMLPLPHISFLFCFPWPGPELSCVPRAQDRSRPETAMNSC